MKWYASLPRPVRILAFIAAALVAALVVYQVGYLVGQAMAETSFLGGGN